MKRFAQILICAAAFAALLCGSAMAAGSDIDVLLNGRPVVFTDAEPMIFNNRTMIPFRAVFVALGFTDESITYQPDTRTVRAVSDGLEISLNIGESAVYVTKDGNTTRMKTDAPAMINNGRTYVPARFVAEAAGCRVGWNGATRAVIIDEIDDILAGNTATYTVLERYLDFERQFQAQTYQVTGSYNQTITDGTQQTEQTGEYTMHTSGAKFDYTTKMYYTGELAALLPDGVDMELRGDVAAGELFFHSDTMSSLLENKGQNVWYQVNFAQISDLFGTGTILTIQDTTEPVNGKAYVESLVRQAAEADMTRSVVDCLARYNAMLSDSAFAQRGSNYVSTMKDPEQGLSVIITFTTSDGKVNGYAVSSTIRTDKLEQIMEQSLGGNEIRSRIDTTEGRVKQTVELTGTYAETTEPPNAWPEARAVIIPWEN